MCVFLNTAKRQRTNQLAEAVLTSILFQLYLSPHLEFHEGDAHTGDNCFWVNAKDQLSLALLALAKVQGRVIGSHD